jgi:hypothetical protein
MKRILFAAGQSAARGFLSPLWARWLEDRDDVDFRIAVHPSARPANGKVPASILFEQIEDEGGLVAALGGWTPDLVVTSVSGKSVERATFDFARRLGIAVWQFVDTWYDYALRIQTTNGNGRLPDRVLVIDERAKREAAEEGIPELILTTVGNPAWEGISPSPPEDGKAVLFVSQHIARSWGDRLGYTERTGWEMVRSAAQIRPDLFPRLIFAPHPDEDASAVGEGAAERIQSGDLGVPVAGCVLGLYSSVMVNALLAGRKVISVQPNATAADKCSLSRHGFIGRARNESELLMMMEMERPGRLDGLKAAVANSCARLERIILEEDHACVSSG